MQDLNPWIQWSETTDVEVVLGQMSLEERVHMLSGHGFYGQFLESGRRWGAHAYKAGGGCERLGVPYLMFSDGPRGVVRGNSTCFPCTMARGATFDVHLEERVGEVIGIESRAQGANLSGAVCVNLLRHPAWGRAQETYGEDTYHLGLMGSALSKGIQKHGVIATVKHFAVNSIENARFKVDVKVDERSLHEVYLAHFKEIIDSGCQTLMTSYNKLNGEYCGENSWLLTDLLRDQWGFEGVTHSDWGLGVYSVDGVDAGLDIENPEPRIFGANLVDAVKEGRVSEKAIDTACLRILSLLKKFNLPYDDNSNYPENLVGSIQHVDLARQVAEKSITLIKNDDCLPWNKKQVRNLALIGSLAHRDNIGDKGSSRVRPEYVKSIAEGLFDLLGDQVEIRTAFEDELEMVRSVSRWADAVLVVAGYTADDEGEYIPGDISLGVLGHTVDQGEDKVPKKLIDRGGDRSDLTLGKSQENMIQAASSENRNTAVAIVSGSAVIKENWKQNVPAIIYNFYSGMEGGSALADILFGNVNPSGHLPFSVPKSVEHLPFFDKNADEIEYGLYAGYTHLNKFGHRPAFPFGHGLSYTSFKYSNISATVVDDVLQLTVCVTNAGDKAGDDVVQAYLFPPGEEIERQEKLLKGFKRISLKPGQSHNIRLDIPILKLKFWCPIARSWKLERGLHTIIIGENSNCDLQGNTQISFETNGSTLTAIQT